MDPRRLGPKRKKAVMCFCEDDLAAFRARTHPKARKPHACEECACTISPGTRYVRDVAKWEGDINVNVMCLDCAAWAGALCRAQDIVCGCSGWPIGALWNEIADFAREHLSYDPDGEDDPDTVYYPPDPKLSGFTFSVVDGIGF